MKDFIIKLIAAVIVVAAIIQYDSLVEAREAEAEAKRIAVEEENARIEAENAALLKSLGLSEEAEEAADGPFTDGVYTASANGYGGKVQIELTVSGGNITDLEITSASGEDAAYLAMASTIIDNILDAQSADVSTVSGATLSSTAIKNAAAQAIEEASK